MAAPTLIVQTTYAELLERCASRAFDADFPEEGSFTAKLINDRRYWYFQGRTQTGRVQRYVGPETEELLERIEHHRQAREDEGERRALVATLVRSYGLPAPLPAIGEVIGALARAGTFRLRGVLVGTVAYQAYPAILGVKLPSSLLQTSDVDIAQFTNVSVSVGDQTPPMLQVLKGVDKAFREVPTTSSLPGTTSYSARGGMRVDFLTPNEGADTDDPQVFPALQTAAQPLRFLDFLIHDPVHAVLLHGAGILVKVPAPERFAVHKLMLTRRRTGATAKSGKDALQASALLEVLADRRPQDLRAAWQEAWARGPTWRKLLLGGMGEITPGARDKTLAAVGCKRSLLPGLDLTFDDPPLRFDSAREVVTFAATAAGHAVQCAVSREAIEDHFGGDGAGKDGLVAAVRRSRSLIEDLLRTKYLASPVEEAAVLLLKTSEVPELAKAAERHKGPRQAKS
jgi:hypothetical protein